MDFIYRFSDLKKVLFSGAKVIKRDKKTAVNRPFYLKLIKKLVKYYKDIKTVTNIIQNL